MADFVAQVNPDACHTAIQVRDLDKMLAFYQDVVGLPFLRRTGPDAAQQVVWLQGMQLIDAGKDADLAPTGAFHHTGINVSNIEEIVARLEEAGAKADVPLEERSFPVDLKLAFYFDPEGNRFEVVQYK